MREKLFAECPGCYTEVSLACPDCDRLESENAALKKERQQQQKAHKEKLDNFARENTALKRAAIRDGRGGYVDGCVSGSEYKRVHEGQRKALEEVDALKKEVRRLEGKAKTTECVYCGETFPLDTVTGEQVGEHIRTCKKHPLHHALTRAETAEAKIDAGVTYLKISNAVYLPNEQIDKIFDREILDEKEKK